MAPLAGPLVRGRARLMTVIVVTTLEYENDRCGGSGHCISGNPMVHDSEEGHCEHYTEMGCCFCGDELLGDLILYFTATETYAEGDY